MTEALVQFILVKLLNCSDSVCMIADMKGKFCIMFFVSICKYESTDMHLVGFS